MGNSEVGHVNLGAGRIVYQDFARINMAVEKGEFEQNPAVVEALGEVKSRGGAVHIMGLMSPGGVHSHTDHLLAAVRAAKVQGLDRVHIHAFLDGRDTPPRSAIGYINDFEQGLAEIGIGNIVSVCGRYYAMDRDNRWDRVQRAYDMLTLGEGERAERAVAAVEAAYGRDENDEFVQPTLVAEAGAAAVRVEDGDLVLMANFRADRMREICHALTDPEEGQGAFEGFERRRLPKLAAFLCMTQYDATLKGVGIAYPPNRPKRTLGEELSRLGLSQLRIAETEKYAHVTYFFNGGEEQPFEGEDRVLIPSPKVDTYDLKPEMSAVEVTDALIERIESGRYDFIAVNYANADMVGHTGVYEAAIRAIETLDRCLGRLEAAVTAAGGEMLITADHGNADMMMAEESGQPHTAHTNNPVPLLHIGRPSALRNGRLSDIAPTVMALMGLSQPKEMSGTSLVELKGH